MPHFREAVLLLLVFSAAAYDLRYRRVPNWLNLAGLIAGMGINGVLSGWHGLATAALGMLLALLIYVPLYLLRAMGAGDVKLMAAVGAIVGPQNWLWIFLASAIAGGVVSLLLIAWKKRFYQTFLNLAVIGAELARFHVPARADQRLDIRNPDSLRLPYAAVIACGAVVFLLSGVFN